MQPGGYQPFSKQGGLRPPGATLAAMLAGRPAFMLNPIQGRRDGQVLARLLLTGRLPDN